MPDKLSELKQEIVSRFNEAKDILEILLSEIKASEQKQVPLYSFSVINELRYVGQHYFRYISSNNSIADEKETHLKAALAHSRRAIYDALDLRLELVLKEWDAFCYFGRNDSSFLAKFSIRTSQILADTATIWDRKQQDFELNACNIISEWRTITGEAAQYLRCKNLLHKEISTNYGENCSEYENLKNEIKNVIENVNGLIYGIWVSYGIFCGIEGADHFFHWLLENYLNPNYIYFPCLYLLPLAAFFHLILYLQQKEFERDMKRLNSRFAESDISQNHTANNKFGENSAIGYIISSELIRQNKVNFDTAESCLKQFEIETGNTHLKSIYLLSVSAEHLINEHNDDYQIVCNSICYLLLEELLSFYTNRALSHTAANEERWKKYKGDYQSLKKIKELKVEVMPLSDLRQKVNETRNIFYKWGLTIDEIKKSKTR